MVRFSLALRRASLDGRYGQAGFGKGPEQGALPYASCTGIRGGSSRPVASRPTTATASRPRTRFAVGSSPRMNPDRGSSRQLGAVGELDLHPRVALLDPTDDEDVVRGGYKPNGEGAVAVALRHAGHEREQRVLEAPATRNDPRTWSAPPRSPPPLVESRLRARSFRSATTASRGTSRNSSAPGGVASTTTRPSASRPTTASISWPARRCSFGIR